MSDYGKQERYLDHQRLKSLIELYTKAYKSDCSDEWVAKYLDLIELEVREMRKKLDGGQRGEP